MKLFFTILLTVFSNLFGVRRVGEVIPTSKPPKTPSWFSSAYTFPSEPIFALPGAYMFTTKGVEISFPKPTASEKLIAAPFTSLCTLNRGHDLIRTEVLTYSDWSVTMVLSDELGNWTVTVTQGVPYIDSQSALPLVFSCTNLVSSSPDTFQVDGRTILYQQHKKDFRVSLIPSVDGSVIEQFRLVPLSPIVSTNVSWKSDGNQWVTTYSLMTRDKTPVLFTLWPHHVLSEREQVKTIATYDTVLGPLKLARGNEWTLRTAVPDLPVNFSAVKNVLRREEIQSAIKSDASVYKKSGSIPTAVYFRGTALGATATLTQLADLYDLTTLRNELLEILERELTHSTTRFTYDENKKMYVSLDPEFGNELGNDHHFHYGYYIRAAAIVVAARPELRARLEPMITEMIADIANTKKEGDRYPYLRSYSVIEGHSWADGRGKFADGNNQESSSEALNAWYGIKLWGDVTQNPAYSELGSWLFSQELLGARAYWFADSNAFPSAYARPVASLVWGGKREYATWFSGEPMHIVGIQFLPLTPASLYLKDILTLPAILKDTSQRTKTPYAHEWGDLFGAVEAQVNHSGISPDLVSTTAGLKLRSLFLQILYSSTK